MREKTLIIIPAYNEEESIGEVVKGIKDKYPELDILLVDDGSMDKTKDIAKGKVDFLISLPFHLGLGVALQTGYIFAEKNNYDFVIHFDADGQHLASEIEKLLIPLKEENYDFVIGSRDSSEYRFSFFRKIASLSISKMLSLFLKLSIKDPTSGFRAMKRKVFSIFTKQYPHDYPEIEELILLKKYGLKLKEVPVKMHLRLRGRSSFTLGKAFFYLFKVFFILILDIFWLIRLHNNKYKG